MKDVGLPHEQRPPWEACDKPKIHAAQNDGVAYCQPRTPTNTKAPMHAYLHSYKHTLTHTRIPACSTHPHAPKQLTHAHTPTRF
jgi:hypothetical protein